jgi:hypothetical protein
MTVPQVQISARDHYLTLLDPLPLSGAIAIPSVLYRESRLNPGSQGVQASEHGGILNRRGAYGIASWNGPQDQSKVGDPVYDRQAALLAFATEHGVSAAGLETDLNIQLDFVLTEMANRYPLSWAAVRSGASYQSIIEVVVDEYENPKDKVTEINDAVVIANALAKVPLTTVPVPMPLPLPPSPKPVPTPAPTSTPATSGAARRAEANAELQYYLDYLETKKAAEIAALTAEFDAEIAAMKAAMTSTSSSTATPATTHKGTLTMPTGLINYKTTISGIITAAGQVATAIPAFAPYANIISAIGAVLMGYFAQDGAKS